MNFHPKITLRPGSCTSYLWNYDPFGKWVRKIANLIGSTGSIQNSQMGPLDPLVNPSSGSTWSIGHPVDPLEWMLLLTNGSIWSTALNPLDLLNPLNQIDPLDPFEWTHCMSSGSIGSSDMDLLDVNGSTGSIKIQWIHSDIFIWSTGSTGSIWIDPLYVQKWFSAALLLLRKTLPYSAKHRLWPWRSIRESPPIHRAASVRDIIRQISAEYPRYGYSTSLSAVAGGILPRPVTIAGAICLGSLVRGVASCRYRRGAICLGALVSGVASCRYRRRYLNLFRGPG